MVTSSLSRVARQLADAHKLDFQGIKKGEKFSPLAPPNVRGLVFSSEKGGTETGFKAALQAQGIKGIVLAGPEAMRRRMKAGQRTFPGGRIFVPIGTNSDAGKRNLEILKRL